MFENLRFYFSYCFGGKSNSITFKESFANDAVKVEISLDRTYQHEKLRLSILPVQEVEIRELYATMDFTFASSDRIFVNGYQSWTDSREFFIQERMPGISKLAAPILRKYKLDKYGDYTFKKYSRKKGEFHGYTYSYIRNGEQWKLLGSLSERSGYTIIEKYTGKNAITIRKDCAGHHIDSEYVPFEILWVEGTEAEVFDTYFQMMNIKSPRVKPMTGWTSWYNYYQNISEDIILENLINFKSLNKNIGIFQIDDGYQTAIGDWLSVDQHKFPHGMKYIADQIKTSGYMAGIWLAPFVCETNSSIYKEKKHWLLRDEKGALVAGGSNWSGFYALDFYNPEVQQYIKEVFETVLGQWNYDMVKLDFLYAVCLIPRKNKTRGQIMTEAMEFLRQCVGDKLILGCGVPLGPAFGMVDYCRIGCDVSLDWDDKFYMRLLHRERISTLNAIRSTIGRRQLDRRAFMNDPDVFLLRDDNIGLTETQKETLAAVNRLFGSLIFTSDNISKYEDKKHMIFDRMMSLKERTIDRVEQYDNGLVEILYQEDKTRYLALVNLSGGAIDYVNHSVGLKDMGLDAPIHLEAYKILEFAIEA